MKAIKNTEGRIIPRSCAVTEEQAWKQACVIDSHMMRCMQDGYRCVEVEITEAEQARPVAWKFKEVIHCGQGQFYDSDWRVSLNEPPDNKVCVLPLYAHPPVPEGMVMVPVEPAEEMLGALNVWAQCEGDIKAGYKAMLAAAPKGEK